jgi:oligoribonuclease (3'-5' exoribonuclease)
MPRKRIQEPRLLCWLDLESTGDTIEDPILEVAAVVTDFTLRTMGQATVVVDPKPFDWMQRLERNEFVMNMHIRSGLVGDLLAGKGMSAPAAEAELIALLEDYGKPQQFMLAGRGISWFDRDMLKAHMPTLSGWFVRPTHDVGEVRRFLKRICKRDDLLWDDEDQPLTHRALADIEAHIAEDRYYRDLMEQVEAPA